MNMLIKKSLLLYCIVIALIGAYVQIAMIALIDDSGSSLSSLIKLVIIVISILYGLKNNVSRTSMYNYWLFWCLWIIFDFYVLGMKGVGMSNLFHALFPACCYFMFYHFFSKNKISKYHLIGFLLLWLETVYLNYRTTFFVDGLVLGSDAIVSNMIFWNICFIPFLLLLKNNPLKITLLVISFMLSLISGKRSASICVGLIVIFTIYPLLKNKSNSLKIGIISLFFTLILLGYNYLSFYFGYIVNRINDSDPDGNGRLPIYQKVLNTYEDGDFISILFGNGYNSIYNIIGTNAHNDALQMLFDYGIVGFFFYVAFICLAFKNVIKSRRYSQNFYPSILASFLIIIVLGMVSNLYAFNSYFAFICSIFGMYEGNLNNNNNVYINCNSRV